jgi:hypothetical protein
VAKTPVNVAGSVKTRLLNHAREERQPFDVLLVRFALERLLYRLSVSPLRDRFILKGGLLVTLWLEDDNRVTRDADFLAFGDASAVRLIADFGTVMAIEADDGLVFDVDALTARPIREEAEYGGMRLSTTAYLERTRIPVTIDLGFGDALADPAPAIPFPTMLDFPDLEIRAYSPTSVIAEKFQAMVALGIANGRMKDFYDLWAVPQACKIDPQALDAAIGATFERRGIPIPVGPPPGLSAAMAEDGDKRRQWEAYAASIELDGVPFAAVVDAVWDLVGPSCERLLARQ